MLSDTDLEKRKQNKTSHHSSSSSSSSFIIIIIMANLKHPNVVFILTDDQGYGELGCTGNKHIKTPNIDRLHDESIRFVDYHVGTTCAPTRSGLLTGHFANSTGVWHTIGGRSLLREDEWTLPQALSESGYATAHFGKWHLGDAAPLRPFERGFDLSIYHGGGGIGQTPDNWGNDYFDDTYFCNGKPIRKKGYCTDVFFSEAIKFIEQQQDNQEAEKKPFFCYIATNAPHFPFNVENQYADIYRGIAPTEDQARFYGMVTNIDDNVGKLRTRLEELHLSENTIVIFMSDNGSGGGVSGLDKNGHVTEGPCNYNAGMRGCKGWEYEGGHRVPFIIHVPPATLGEQLSASLVRDKIDSDTVGRDVHDLVCYVDFMPTILDLTNVKVPSSRKFHGISLGPTIRGWEQVELHDRAVVTDTQRIARPVKWYHSCVMKQKWRLINGIELYNIENDPGQLVDIADQNPNLVFQLRNHYEKWWEIVSRQFDLDVPYAIGISNEVVSLTAHDIRNEAGDVPWQQRHVRSGKVVSGYWALDVRSAGNYTIELRRWPQSTGYKLDEGIDGDDSGWRRDCIQSSNAPMYEGGVAMKLRWAHIEIAGLSLHAEIAPGSESVSFDTELTVGETKLYAGFFDNVPGTMNQTIAPYYIYISKTT